MRINTEVKSFGATVSEVGKSFSGMRGIIMGAYWEKRKLFYTVRWESGIYTDEPSGRITFIGGKK